MTGSTISGLVTLGVTLGDNYASPLTITASGDVATQNQFAIYSPASLASAFVINYGTISAGGLGAGIALFGSGTVINSGTVASIYGGYGLLLAHGGMLTNGGEIIGGSAGFSHGSDGVYLENGGTVSNSGTIAGGGGIGGGVGVQGTNGGTVINTGVILGGGSGEKGGGGGAAIAINGGNLINHGTLTGGTAESGGGAGVAQSGGTSMNFGHAIGGNGANGEVGLGNAGAGLVLESAGTFTNDGTLAGGYGVYTMRGSVGSGDEGGAGATIGAGAVLKNTGLILGGQGGYNRNAGTPNSGAGVYIDGGTVLNAGDIEGGLPSDIRGGLDNGEPGDAVLFGSLSGVLSLAAGSELGGAVAGFAGADSIVLEGVTETGFTYVSGVGLEVFAGSLAETLDITGSFSMDNFVVVNADGDATIALDGTMSMPCFTAGTRILTVRGEVAVEELLAGDEIINFDGEEKPIVWIGTRELDVARHVQPETVRPVIIEPGALADGVPARRLEVSPDHALYLHSLLVQAKDLINGRTIWQDMNVTKMCYYHVKLAAHDILLAEGAAAESYLDTGHRGVFENAGTPLLLHPALMQMRREVEGCAPLCLGGEKLAAIREALARRLVIAPVQGWAGERGRSRAV